MISPNKHLLHAALALADRGWRTIPIASNAPIPVLPHTALRAPPSMRWLIAGMPCTSPGKGDGVRDLETGRWVKFPCRKKTCPRHWQRYAVRTYCRVKDRLGTLPYWYHVRLSCKRHIQPGERFQALSKFRAKMHAEYGALRIISIAHRGRKGDHFHLLVGNTVSITADVVNAFWRAHFPAKATHKYRDDYTRTVPHNNPRRLLWYALLGPKKKPREEPPWLDIPLRSPVWVDAPPHDDDMTERTDHERMAIQRRPPRRACGGRSAG